MSSIPMIQVSPGVFKHCCCNPTDLYDLSVTKTNNAPYPYDGSVITYTVVVTNNGPAAANNVSVNDSLHYLFNYNPASFNITYTGGAGPHTSVWPNIVISTMPPGSTATITYQGYFDSIIYDRTNTVTISPDPVNNANNTATSTVFGTGVTYCCPRLRLTCNLCPGPSPAIVPFGTGYDMQPGSPPDITFNSFYGATLEALAPCPPHPYWSGGPCIIPVPQYYYEILNTTATTVISSGTFLDPGPFVVTGIPPGNYIIRLYGCAAMTSICKLDSLEHYPMPSPLPFGTALLLQARVDFV